jgi:hypothetical protein
MAKCTCKVGPGKFEGEGALTFLCYQLSLDGVAEDDAVGAYSFFKLPLSDVGDLQTAAREYGYCDECIASAAAEHSSFGFYVWERDDGFVCGEVLKTEIDYEDYLAQAEDESSEE